jgi:phosphoserine/homoserine phosphotransferase
MVFAIDLEGVLAPEIWPRLGEHFDIPELHLTTRDLGDFDALMRQRVAVQMMAKAILRETESPTLTDLPPLEYHQTKRVDHRLILRRH